MGIGRKNEKMQNQMNPRDYEFISMDNKMKMIYNRYRSGKCIIIDDIKYLWLKDPEGFEKLGRRILELKTDKEMEMGSINVENIEPVKKNAENVNEQKIKIDYKYGSDTPTDTAKNVMEALASLKSLIGKMSERELQDMLKSLNEALELKKLANEMKFWDDGFVDKMIMYTHDTEKEFDMLA